MLTGNQPENFSRLRELGNSNLRLRVASVMHFRPFREQPLAPALAPAGEGGPAALGLHPRAKTVLAFPGAL